MKILLLNPPYTYPNPKGITKLELFQPSVGLASIASYAHSKGMDVKYYDLWDKSYDYATNLLKGEKVDVVGITCVSSQHLNARLLTTIVKEIYKEAIIIIGGPHASVLDEQVISTFHADYVVRGEGELTFYELVNALEDGVDIGKVRGITYKTNGEIVRTPDRELIHNLDNLPFGDYTHCDFSRFKSVLENEYYYNPKLKKGVGLSRKIRFAPICSSRGCNNSCTFCYSSFWKGVWRYRSPENIIEEIMCLQKQYNVNHITFTDDSFAVNLDRVARICELILVNNLDITFDAGARVYPISLEVLRLMKRAGCIRLSFGVESGSAEILKKMKKNVSTGQIIHAFDLAHQADIPVFATIMAGNLGETDQSICQTIKLIKKIRPNGLSCNPAYVMPGTHLYKISSEKGTISDSFWEHNPTVPIFRVEHPVDKVRYFQKKILFFHHLFQWDLGYIIKYLFTMFILKLGLLMKVDADLIRDNLLKLGFIRRLIKKLPQ